MTDLQLARLRRCNFETYIMSFFKRLTNLLTGKSSGDNRIMTIYALCNRGKEPVRGEVDLFNELSLDEGDGPDSYYVRKVLHTSGESRNFGQVEVELWFDKSKRLDRYEVTGGRWLEAEEYEQEIARFNAPSEQDENE